MPELNLGRFFGLSITQTFQIVSELFSPEMNQD